MAVSAPGAVRAARRNAAALIAFVEERDGWGRRSKPRRKFSSEQIAQICVLRWVQWSYSKIAKLFGVTAGAIWAIDNGRSQADLVEHLREMHASGALTAALDAQQIRESALSLRSRRG